MTKLHMPPRTTERRERHTPGDMDPFSNQGSGLAQAVVFVCAPVGSMCLRRTGGTRRNQIPLTCSLKKE